MKTWNSSWKVLTLAFSLLGIATFGACGRNAEGLADEAAAGDSGLVGLNPPPEADAPGDATPAPGAPSVPVTPPTTPVTCYRYAFVSGFADNVFTADTCSGAAPRQITENNEPRTHFGNLAFQAPQGTDLVFDRSTLSLDGILLESFTAHLGGLNPLIEQNTAALFNGFANGYVPHTLALEPGGARTVFLRDETYGNGLGQDYQLITVDRLSLYDPNESSLAEQQLYEAPNADEKIVEAVWRPGFDQLIVVKRRPGGENYLYAFYIQGHRMSPLRADSVPSYYLPLAFEGSEPAISPDGSTMSFVRRIQGQRQIFACTLAVDAGYGWRHREACENVRQLTSEGENMHPAWTPDGRFLFFTTNRAGNLDLYRMNAHGGEETPIRNSFADEARPAVHPIPFQM